jgi:hypothetical protein
LALAVEEQQPTFRSRLISAIQFMRVELASTGISTAMVGAMVEEAEELARPIDFTQVIKIDRLTTLATAAVVVVIGFGAACAATAPESVALLQRSMLMNVPVPRKTQVECLSKDIFVPRGEPVTIAAKASGLIIPDSGWVEIEYPNGATQKFTIDKDADSRDQYSVLECAQRCDDIFERRVERTHGTEPSEACARAIARVATCLPGFACSGSPICEDLRDWDAQEALIVAVCGRL